MIQIESKTYASAATATRVRQNVFSAAIAAAMMLWYGFGRLRLSGESGAFGLGDAMTIHALRIGGVAMVFSALASMTGLRWALLYDGVCSVLIGAIFCIGAALMMSDNGPGFLYIIFGAMFIASGVRNAREWASLAPPPAIKQPRTPDPRTANPRDVMTMNSLAGKLQERKHQPDPVIPPPPPSSRPVETEPPPEGFLSSFAPEQEDNSDNT